MDDKSTSVTITGCGRLGLPLGKKLCAAGWKVRGSTTTKDKLALLKSAGIEGYPARFPPDEPVEEGLFRSKNLLINIPPGRNNPEALQKYLSATEQIIKLAKNGGVVSKIIFISSTSVYGDSFDLIDEQTIPAPMTDAGKVLLKAEEIISASPIPYVILRFGGLAGPGLHPGRFLAGRQGLVDGKQLVNFLHLDDAHGIISWFLKNPANEEIYNVVSPKHPDKAAFYTHMAKIGGFDPPGFSENAQELKRKEISADKLIRKTNYVFKFPDPMLFTF